MLKRYREYAQDNPFNAWLLEIAFLTTLSVVCAAVLFGYNQKPFPLGSVFLTIAFVVSPPTTALVRRFSPEERREAPVTPRQERGVGTVSVALALCSIGAFILVLFGRRMAGLVTSDDASLLLLMAFSYSALFSVMLGYAVRHTPLGRSGLRISLGWIVLLLLTVAALIISRIVRGVGLG